MEAERFTGQVMSDYLEIMSNLIKQKPDLLNILGSHWVEKNCTRQSIKNVQPLFWQLVTPYGPTIADALIDFANRETRRAAAKRFLKEITTEQDSSNVRGHIRELQCYAYLRSLGHSFQWQPPLELHRPDFRISTTSDEIFLEVFSIGQSAEEQAQQDTNARLQAEVNLIEGNPYRISIFSPVPMPLIPSFISNLTEYIRSTQNDPTERTVIVDGIEVLLMPTENGAQGGLAGLMGDVRNLDDGGRIKHRIMNKLKRMQLPRRSHNHHLNGFVVFLDTFITTDFYFFESALFGQHAIEFVSDRSQASRATHLPNGVLSHDVWAQHGAGNINFFFVSRAKPGESLNLANSRLITDDQISRDNLLRTLLPSEDHPSPTQ